jgi:hypothetical protein
LTLIRSFYGLDKFAVIAFIRLGTTLLFCQTLPGQASWGFSAKGRRGSDPEAGAAVASQSIVVFFSLPMAGGAIGAVPRAFYPFSGTGLVRPPPFLGRP